MENPTFRNLGLSENAIAAIKKKGFEEPTDIQIKTIPLLLAGENDIVAQAQTGTGKTAAFGLPILDILEPGNQIPGAIILTPTRELAIQVSEEINSLKGKKKFSVLPIYGGQSMEMQLRSLRKGVDIVVGTPGRVIDHINRKTLNLSEVKFFVLDEADEMLNMGFIEDVELILKQATSEKKTLLFSATIPERIRILSKKYLKNPKTIIMQKNQLTTDLAEQIYFEVTEQDRFEALCRIIDMEKDFYGLIFCRTKVDVDNLYNKLADRGYNVELLHGDISQHQRERVLSKFKNKRVNILVATDVAARGIDIIELSHVINYSLPQNPESYVHRIGRTGRAGKDGIAVTFITPEEYRTLVYIKRVAKTEIKKGKIPDVNDIISSKKERLKNELWEIIKENKHIAYMEVAKDILDSDYAPDEILSAMIKHTLSAEFDKTTYAEIRAPFVSIDRKGSTRLFIALGRANKMTESKIADYINNETGVKRSLIRDIKVLDTFSFITVPFEEAEMIISIFKQRKEGGKSLIARAKEKRKR
ncbi:MAG: RNA helicase [bacterium (Candidatus Stahlbacteria) CG23_combo_of_CG06-09_8_20_14_all_34_7]|nr:MAG: RNA helicase [bacterium (Candidatus Stahlbacteria) CG23_combo_of_CG06-09_8_20_14_all_34_7]